MPAHRNWMTAGTALLLIVAVVLLVFVVLPQSTSQDLSSNPVEHAPTSERS
jgi:hypothetical protein